MKVKETVLKLSLVLASILVCLVLLETAIRAYHAARNSFPPAQIEPLHIEPLHIVVDSPILYGLNPEHPEISSQGLRDDEVPIPKPEGTFRILILGDSVAYGESVLRNETFANRLEGLLRKRIRSTEVINAGVAGYTAYNELQYYLSKGRYFKPDIVIVAFCMNDVANPRLHWNYTGVKIVNIPAQAIPNHEYDLNDVLPRLRRKESLWQYSELYNATEWRISGLYKAVEGRISGLLRKPSVPTYITGEDRLLSIEVLLDETSPEWRWLASIYDQLHNAVQAEQATLIIALFPLAYQVASDYPFFPQHKILEYCEQNSIYCIDLLPSFRKHPKEDIFLLNTSGYDDIWHLTEYGHEVSAEEILRFLQDRQLILGRD